MKQIAIVLLVLFTASVSYGAGQTVEYSVDDIAYEGYFTAPTGSGAPLLLLVHDWDGLTDYEVKRAEMLKDLGYAVFAADLFGKGVRPTEVKDKKQHTGELYKDRAKMRRILKASLDQGIRLGGNGKNAAAFGYCFGGAAVLELARSGADLKSFISFHGGLSTPDGQSYGETKGDVIVFHGTADTAITMDDFAALAVELEETKVTHEMITYGGAPHAFTVFGSQRYREDADRKSWQRFTQYLEETLD
ncbi:MAG: dienelactone hydrolase family protein [Desulfobulbaceae bacterium]|nr:MAG: dienelactone hydrolase family protein [Desulfobulbaceae bacterium]